MVHGSTIRSAFEYGILKDGQKYMDMLRDRNLIAHTYKESISMEIYQRIKEKHRNTLEKFIKEFDKRIE